MSKACLHCGLPVPENSDGGPDFCCHGCEAAYAIIDGMGLESYYARRCIDPDIAPMKPEDNAPVIDLAAYVQHGEDGAGNSTETLHLMVEGIQCAACVWLIEKVLGQEPGVTKARVNMTTRRLVLTWKTGENDAETLVAHIVRLGYHLAPFDPCLLGAETDKRQKELMQAMAVAGFAAGNVMLLSVSIWAAGPGHGDMGPGTRSLLHWVSALIALPAIAFAGLPFFRSAITALRAKRMNMDVPISLAIVLTAGISLLETIQGGAETYFESAVMLLFFLLIGRYLDARARARARSVGEHLMALGASAVTIEKADGSRELVSPNAVKPGDIALVAAGERISVDGEVISGESDVDTQLISGETVPVAVAPGAKVFAGTTNIAAPLRLRVSGVGEGTLLAEIVRLMEVAEEGRAKYVAIADRVARLYAPVVHILGLITFLGWSVFGDVGWREALLTGIAVLIITCPCALALAVPVVQIVASGRFLRQGILLKSATALERLAKADTVVFDKTGTLTLGRPVLADMPDAEALTLAASLAANSKHPLARALAAAAPTVKADENVIEVPGHGMEKGDTRLGRREWCGDTSAPDSDAPELWLSRPGHAPVRFAFTDTLRADAAETVAELKRRGFSVELLSGDRNGVVDSVAKAAGIDVWHGQRTPAEKVARLETLRAEGRHVAMVGDGLNDAPALAAADVSLSPSSAVDVSQTAADFVFQGKVLAPVLEAVTVARATDRLIKQNFGLAFAYNAVTIPLAMAGFVSPLFAALAMSSSSIVVILNALRLGKR